MQCLYVLFQMQHGAITETELLGSYTLDVSSLHTERLFCTVSLDAGINIIKQNYLRNVS